jgi:hypothetical protein
VGPTAQREGGRLDYHGCSSRKWRNTDVNGYSLMRKRTHKERKKGKIKRRKEVTYECVGILLSYARIIFFFLLHFLLEHSCHKWKGIKSSCRVCLKYHRVTPKCLRIKEDKTGNVRIRWHRGAFLQPLLKWKISKYYTSWVCICSLSYPACNAHPPYCHLWPARLYNTVTHYPTRGTTFEKKNRYWT